MQIFKTKTTRSFVMEFILTIFLPVNEETSPKYIIVYLTPSSSTPSNSETDVLWLDTLSPAEKIAIILAITTLLIIILTGICYNGRASCRRSSRQKNRGSQDTTAIRSGSELGRANQGGVVGIINQTPFDSQRNGHQGNPQIVIYNMPNIGSSSSDHRPEQSRSTSRDFLSVPRYSDLSPPPLSMPLNQEARNQSYSAPNLYSKSPPWMTDLNISKSAQCLLPQYPGYRPLNPTAPPGDGTVFFN